MRILVVEDDAATRDLLQRSLEDAGHEVTVVERCEDGLRWGLDGPCELAIVDVMLPDGSGLDLCRALHAGGLRAPILFLTARGEVEDRIAGLDAGGDDYLRKPFAIAELRARIRALARRGGLGPPPSVSCGDVVIDFAARSLRAAGRAVTLTAREWAVLDILAAHAGRMVTRTELIDSAWPHPGEGASESLDVIVSRLRRKLGEGRGPRIRTVRGEGLILEVPE